MPPSPQKSNRARKSPVTKVVLEATGFQVPLAIASGRTRGMAHSLSSPCLQPVGQKARAAGQKARTDGQKARVMGQKAEDAGQTARAA